MIKYNSNYYVKIFITIMISNLMKNFMMCNLDEKFHNETGYHVSELLRIKNIKNFLNNMVNVVYSLNTLTSLSLKEFEKLMIL